MKKLSMILSLALILCLMVGCQDKEAMAELEAMKAQAEVEEQNKEVVRQFIEALDKGNFDIHEELCADDYVCYFAGVPEPMNREAQKQFISTYYEAFPDNTHTIEDLIAKGNKVILRQSNRGTHQGDYEGIPPTGNKVEYFGILIFEIADGKMVKAWGTEDMLTFMMQLGMELKPKEGEK
jgi:steroid delta-isomerase-like uncharacterized protein